MPDHAFDKLAILGIGLLGSSIAHAVRAYGGASEVALWDESEEARQMPIEDTIKGAEVELQFYLP